MISELVEKLLQQNDWQRESGHSRDPLILSREYWLVRVREFSLEGRTSYIFTIKYKGRDVENLNIGDWNENYKQVKNWYNNYKVKYIPLLDGKNEKSLLKLL